MELRALNYLHELNLKKKEEKNCCVWDALAPLGGMCDIF